MTQPKPVDSNAVTIDASPSGPASQSDASSSGTPFLRATIAKILCQCHLCVHGFRNDMLFFDSMEIWSCSSVISFCDTEDDNLMPFSQL